MKEVVREFSKSIGKMQREFAKEISKL